LGKGSPDEAVGAHILDKPGQMVKKAIFVVRVSASLFL